VFFPKNQARNQMKSSKTTSENNDKKKAKKSVSHAKIRTIRRMFAQQKPVAEIMKVTDLPRRTVYYHRKSDTECVRKKQAAKQIQRAIKEAVRKLKDKKINRKKNLPRLISVREIIAYLKNHAGGLKLDKKHIPSTTKMSALVKQLFPSTGAHSSELKREWDKVPNHEITDAQFRTLGNFANRGFF
jgi:hypothetical protein